ncbi:L-tryptophan decarboxylase [Colletotrichum siamense]|uniref:L-tryptophan decarboxylase n=1 Tax=Colletotrichum siamense TaxID=690259 RepID=A0A9P5EX81_COLSI|nr:L-tryptophan decarboxylase [Colletotrichum tropicale]KAF4857084.1 L-tryptophan decarboxylase [Colletotrichum siamense]KAF4862086.1 L-tryptophan decarboxylase [Colletotrichum siamense]
MLSYFWKQPPKGFNAQEALQSQAPGHWLPKDRSLIAQWVAEKAKQARAIKHPEPLDPTLEAFKKLVQDDTHLTKLANKMFTESSRKYPQDPVGHNAIKKFDDFVAVMNLVLRSGPEFVTKSSPSTAIGLVGCPINALLDWPMGTISGYEFFLRPEVNAAIAAILNAWGKFLTTPESRGCLDGWLSKDAREMIAMKANNGKTSHTFEELFECNPSWEYFGFGSWDDFFVRRFREGVRPVEAPERGARDPRFPDPTLVVANACESAPLQVRTGVKLFDTFYLKGQPYSLGNMLNCHKRTAEFVGGTVYQAFLSALSYHRWHAPVSGKVVGIEYVPGTYYSENWSEGLAGAKGQGGEDPAAPTYSQPYLSAVATRSIMFIQADNPKIGLMAVVFIGMVEVSSCDFVVREGERIEKGQEIGMFHFGGSSYCMVFRPGVELQMVRPGPWDMDREHNFAVKSALAIVS